MSSPQNPKPPAGGNGITPEEARKAAQKGAETPPPGASMHQCPVPPKTWVEFCLIDMEGNPAAGRRFRAKLTDGSVREGKLGADGCVRFDNIPAGTASISFIDLDREIWERI